MLCSTKMWGVQAPGPVLAGSSSVPEAPVWVNDLHTLSDIWYCTGPLILTTQPLDPKPVPTNLSKSCFPD
jgi:hypothetical protein